MKIFFIKIYNVFFVLRYDIIGFNKENFICDILDFFFGGIDIIFNGVYWVLFYRSVNKEG